jgi:hypothetical protein
MSATGVTSNRGGQPLAAGALAWSFVYVFFSNGTPFDSPNRSEPCPLA